VGERDKITTEREVSYCCKGTDFWVAGTKDDPCKLCRKWAEQIILLLKEINKATNDAGGRLEMAASEHYRKRYRDLLHEAEHECPPPEEPAKKKKGRTKRTIARNLLERLQKFENETLRLMDDDIVPFSNNQAENDLRMTKVQQKISGCFRSMDGAKMFCRIRSYLSTCRKQGVSATEGLRLLFQGKWPHFMTVKEQCAEKLPFSVI